MRVRLFAALLALASVIANASAQEFTKTNCDGFQSEVKASLGPYRLTTLHCQILPGGITVISPDAGSIAVLSGHEIAVARLSSRVSEATHSHDLVFDSLARSYHAHRMVRWSDDSRVLWSAKQERMRPQGGWALGPIRPILIENRLTRELPELRHTAGPLDGLLWTSDGRALALFGAHGSYYRPEVSNPNPSLAFIDAVRGRVIESLALRDINAAQRQTDASALIVRGAEVAVLPDGRMRAFLDIFTPAAPRGGPIRHAWVVWTQGESPRLLPNPYPDSELGTAISADGTRLLIVRRNHRVIQMCPRAPEPGRACIVSAPVDGVLAALHDLETGRSIWTYDMRITRPRNLEYPVPEVSDDGRYGLIGLPPSYLSRQDFVALISMREGSVQQLFPYQNDVAMGFARGSRRMWIRSGGITAVYALQ